MDESNLNNQAFNAASAPEQQKTAANENTPPPPVTSIPQHSLQHREIFLHGVINRESAHSVILQMRALARQNSEPVTLWINSPGGVINDGLAVFDTMRDLMNQGITVNTVSYGICASMGSFLLSAGSPGCRTMLPNAIEMTHQPSQGINVPNADEAENHAKSLDETRYKVESYYAHFMGLDDQDEELRKLLKKYMSPDVYLNAYMAQRLGLIDNIAMQDGGKPSPGIKNEFLRKSIEIDIRVQKRQFDNIDTGPDSIDPRQHVKRLIEYRETYLAKQAANAPAVNTQQVSAPVAP